MYVWGRLARVVLTTKARGPYRPGSESRLAFRCLPTDIDPNIHLNNARYLMLADLGRMDIFLRSGLMRLVRDRGWLPMMGGVQASFVREIRLWRRFEVFSSIAAWSGTQVVGRHRFVLDDGVTAAILLTTAGVYSRRERRYLPIDEVIAALGVDVASPPLTPSESAFLASHAMLRAEGRAAAGQG